MANIYKYMKEIIYNKPHIVDVKVSVLGIRSLVHATENAEIEFTLTN